LPHARFVLALNVVVATAARVFAAVRDAMRKALIAIAISRSHDPVEKSTEIRNSLSPTSIFSPEFIAEVIS